MDFRLPLVKALVLHLSSQSFTALNNVLGALVNLMAKDPHVQNEIRCDGQAMRQLTSLRDSAREDISSLVKNILAHLNQGSIYHRQPYNSQLPFPHPLIILFQTCPPLWAFHRTLPLVIGS